MDPITGGLLVGGANLLGSLFGSYQSGQNTQANLNYDAMALASNQQFSQSQLDQSENFARDTQNLAQQYNTTTMGWAEDFDKNMVEQAQAYNTQQTSTAYQRAAADMKAAGLNPMAMFGSAGPASSIASPAPTISAASSPGAASPTGSTPSALSFNSAKTSPLAGLGGAAENAIGTAMKMQTQDATIANLVAQNAKIQADTELSKATTGLTSQKEKTEQYETGKSGAQMDQEVRKIDVTAADQAKANAIRDILSDQWGNAAYKAGFLGDQAAKAISPLSNIVSSAKSIGGLMNYGTPNKSWSNPHGISSFDDRFHGADGF